MNKLVIFTLTLCLTACANSLPYKQETHKWQSHKDVANWLSNNFSFDKDRQSTIGSRLRAQGASGLLFKNPEKLYNSTYGYCADAANFAIINLNKVSPKYNARWVFVENAAGRPHHWVAAFDYNSKLYIMDYGAGDKWSDMNGTHGPYDSLDGYKKFLSSLSLPRFAVGNVYLREIPGEED